MNWLAICTLLCMPDRHHLTRLADSASFPSSVILAMAYVETRNNLDPKVRGQHAEWGRFQWKLSSAAWRCPGVDVRTYEGNVTCTLTSLKADMAEVGLLRAVARHNGRSESSATKVYVEAVLAHVGRLSLEEAK